MSVFDCGDRYCQMLARDGIVGYGKLSSYMKLSVHPMLCNHSKISVTYVPRPSFRINTSCRDEATVDGLCAQASACEVRALFDHNDIP